MALSFTNPHPASVAASLVVATVAKTVDELRATKDFCEILMRFDHPTLLASVATGCVVVRKVFPKIQEPIGVNE